MAPNHMKVLYSNSISELREESSYIDLLTELHTKIEADIIPENEKEDILQYIERLEELLWKYSA